MFQRKKKNEIPPEFLKEDVEEDEMKYQTIVDYCRANNQTFVDGEFPPKLSSWLPRTERMRRMIRAWWYFKDISYEWFRPTSQMYTVGVALKNFNGTDYFLTHNSLYPWSLYSNPQMEEVTQGNLGNCGLIAALALIARHPEILKEIFPRNEISEYGVYQVRLCLYGEWKTIIVDDWFPGDNGLTTATHGHTNQLWVPLIEKALAKTFKSYYGLTAFSTSFAFSFTTDSPVILYTIAHYDKEEFWKMLNNYSEFLMCLGTHNNIKDEKMLSLHAYSLLEVFEEGPHRLVRVRNTSTYDEWMWKGEWSEDWGGWPVDLKRRLIYERIRVSGSFWMSYNDFLIFCEMIFVCKYRPNWGKTRVRMIMGGKVGPNHVMLKINVKKPTILAVSALVPNVKYKQWFYLSIYKGNVPAVELQRPILSSEDFELQPGTYSVILSGAFWITQEFNVVLYSSSTITTELVPIKEDKITKSIQGQVMKYGECDLDTRIENVLVTKLLRYHRFMILMVENQSKDSNLRVHVKFGKSSTYDYFIDCDTDEITDWIPPMSRKIVAIVFGPKKDEFSYKLKFKMSKKNGKLPKGPYDANNYYFKATSISDS